METKMRTDELDRSRKWNLQAVLCNLPLVSNGFRLYISGDWVEEELIYHEVSTVVRVFLRDLSG
jgi:hypothetical protein